MRSALIGYTGLVGSNLLQQTEFSDCYNRCNIAALGGKEYDLIVCAGAPAAKWLANQKPAADWENLQQLMHCLAHVRARSFVLISTVDVFPVPVGVDEYDAINPTEQHPYGRHRFLLERFVAAEFPCTTILRLPGLFGAGLKKNVIYDFLHENNLQAIDARARYQFYDLRRLWRDVQRCLVANLPLVHLATEPVTVAEVAEHGFGRAFHQELPAQPACYDFRSRHAARFGGTNGYLYNRTDMLQALQRFVHDLRPTHATGNLQPGVAA